MATPNPPAEYFISRTGVDAEWAPWIAQELQREGFTTFLQDWDFLPGKSFIQNMARGAECPQTIAVISPEYWDSPFTTEEWQAALANQGLLVARVRPCEIPPLVADHVYLVLYGKGQDEAQRELIAWVRQERRERPVAFPGTAVAKTTVAPAPFPGP